MTGSPRQWQKPWKAARVEHSGKLEGQVETLSITFGDLLSDALMPVVVAIGDMADWLSHLDEGTQRVIVVTAMFAAGLGPALWAVGSLASGVGALITVYGAYQASTIAATIATKGLTVAIMTNPVRARCRWSGRSCRRVIAPDITHR